MDQGPGEVKAKSDSCRSYLHLWTGLPSKVQDSPEQLNPHKRTREEKQSSPAMGRHSRQVPERDFQRWGPRAVCPLICKVSGGDTASGPVPSSQQSPVGPRNCCAGPAQCGHWDTAGVGQDGGWEEVSPDNDPGNRERKVPVW